MELQVIQERIYIIRGMRMMLDYDLAELYQVETKKLKQAVRRNIKRFPEDFMFEITEQEYRNIQIISLRSQNVTSSWGGLRYMPFAFTQEGVSMLSGILTSDIATAAVVRLFGTISPGRTVGTGSRRNKFSTCRNLCGVDGIGRTERKSPTAPKTDRI